MRCEVCRTSKGYFNVWYVEINTLDELKELIIDCGDHVIVDIPRYNEPCDLTIEIYDDYRE